MWKVRKFSIQSGLVLMTTRMIDEVLTNWTSVGPRAISSKIFPQFFGRAILAKGPRYCALHLCTYVYVLTIQSSYFRDRRCEPSTSVRSGPFSVFDLVRGPGGPMENTEPNTYITFCNLLKLSPLRDFGTHYRSRQDQPELWQLSVKKWISAWMRTGVFFLLGSW